MYQHIVDDMVILAVPLTFTIFFKHFVSSICLVK